MFPDKLKVAQEILIFKADDDTNISNYRPIALMTAISSIFEKIIYKRLHCFMENKNLLHPNMFGF